MRHSGKCSPFRCSHFDHPGSKFLLDSSHPPAAGRFPAFSSRTPARKEVFKTFFSALAFRERIKIFEDSSPPSWLQMGGILAWYWHLWEKLGADDWTVEVLHPGYHIPFHDLPPVTQETIKFPSYSLRSVKIQVLQGEVEKMLGNGILEEVNNSFMLTGFMIETSVFSSGLHQERGLNVLHWFKGLLLPGSTLSSFSTITLDHLEQENVSVWGIVF